MPNLLPAPTRRPIWRSIALLAVVALLTASCSVALPDDLLTTDGTRPDGGTPDSAIGAPDPADQTMGEVGTTLPSPDPDPGVDPGADPAVGQLLASFGPWTARELPPFADDRTLEPDTFTTPDRVVVSCDPALESRTFAPGPFTDFAAFPFAGDKLPGLIVEGARIEDGDLRVLPLPRAPLPLVVDLASEAPTVLVDDPSPSSLQNAVSDLMRAADARVSGLSVVPANVRFVQREVSSYEEAILSMGVSLRYDGPSLQAAFSSDFEQQRGVEKHSVMVRLLQPMFTIRVDKSQVFGPGDYFSSAATTGQIEDLTGQGRLGTDNPPVLIDEVTYGRVVYVTVTSNRVTSAEELKVAVSGAYNGFSGDAAVETRNQEIIDTAEIRVEAFGGNDDVALAALESGRIQDFMESVDTSTAAPLSMVLRTLDGTMLEVTDEATITDIGCTRQNQPNEIQMQVDVTGEAWGTLWINGTEISTTKQNQSRLITLDPWLRADSNNRIEIDYWPTFCTGGSMTVSFLVNGEAYRGREWRIAGSAAEWACRETGTWNIDRAAGTADLIDGPPALRLTAGS